LVKALALACAFVASALPAAAAELVMFEARGCHYCVRWHAEVGQGYPLSDEGQRAPLRRVDMDVALPSDVSLIRPVTMTPTFVLVEGGREVGRLVGYAGADFFYGLLGDVMARLPAATPPVRLERSAARQ